MEKKKKIPDFQCGDALYVSFYSSEAIEQLLQEIALHNLLHKVNIMRL